MKCVMNVDQKFGVEWNFSLKIVPEVIARFESLIDPIRRSSAEVSA